MNQDKIGSFIKSIRMDNNLTQKEFAERLNVTYQAVSKWENGKNIPDIGIIKQISEEFNVDIDEILNGEKKDKENKKNNYLYLILGIIIVLLLIFAIVLLNNTNSKNFEFKTISSKCSDFKITGSAAYNKDKTSIYISNIEFCGKNDDEKYQKLNCILYEKNNDNKTKISSCKEAKNLSLKDYLKEVDIKADNYSTTCKRLTSNNLILEISAINSDNKTITYTIPIKLNDSCNNK